MRLGPLICLLMDSNRPQCESIGLVIEKTEKDGKMDGTTRKTMDLTMRLLSFSPFEKRTRGLLFLGLLVFRGARSRFRWTSEVEARGLSQQFQYEAIPSS